MRVHITLVGTFRHLCRDVPIQNWIYHSTFQVLHESNHASKHRRYQTPRMEYMSGICFLIAALPFRETTYTARALPAPYTPRIRGCGQTNLLNQISGHQWGRLRVYFAEFNFLSSAFARRSCFFFVSHSSLKASWSLVQTADLAIALLMVTVN